MGVTFFSREMWSWRSSSSASRRTCSSLAERADSSITGPWSSSPNRLRSRFLHLPPRGGKQMTTKLSQQPPQNPVQASYLLSGITWKSLVGSYRCYEVRRRQVPGSHTPFHPSCFLPSSTAAAAAWGDLSSYRPDLRCCCCCSGAQETSGSPPSVRDCARL